MNFNKLTSFQNLKRAIIGVTVGLCAFSVSILTSAAIELETEYKVADNALFFNGKQLKGDNVANNGTGIFDYRFGRQISAHGDAIKVYRHFVFTTWYRGDKFDRHMMLSRYNKKTGVVKTIEFPHQHSGWQGKWWLGESHNTIAVGISPKDSKIHLLFDMHSYNNSGAFKNDYFRYAYTTKNAATVADKDFKLSLFVKDGSYSQIWCTKKSSNVL